MADAAGVGVRRRKRKQWCFSLSFPFNFHAWQKDKQHPLYLSSSTWKKDWYTAIVFPPPSFLCFLLWASVFSQFAQLTTNVRSVDRFPGFYTQLAGFPMLLAGFLYWIHIYEEAACFLLLWWTWQGKKGLKRNILIPVSRYFFWGGRVGIVVDSVINVRIFHFWNTFR